MLPSIPNTLDMQGRDNFTMAARGSNRLQSNPRTANFTTVDRGSSGLQWTANFTTVDRGFSGLQWNPELENTQKVWKNCPKTCSTQENHRQVSRESSVDSYTSIQNRDSFVVLRHGSLCVIFIFFNASSLSFPFLSLSCFLN